MLIIMFFENILVAFKFPEYFVLKFFYEDLETKYSQYFHKLSQIFVETIKSFQNLL